MKKLISIGVCVVMAVCLFNGVISSNGDEINVYINGAKLEFDVPPQIIDNRTMIPMRALFEGLGVEVEWYEDIQSITAGKDYVTINLQIGSYELHIYVYPDKERTPIPISPWIIPLDVPPMIVDGRTLVPIRAIMEGLDADVDWDEENRAVMINFNWEEIAPWKRSRG